MRSAPERARLVRLASAWSVVVATACAASFGCSSESSGAGEAPLGEQTDSTCEVSYENFAGPFVLNWCVGCHSSKLGAEERAGAPVGVDFDTLDGIRQHSMRMHDVVVDAPRMPPLGGPSAEERRLFGVWLDCGAKSSGAGFAPPPPPPVMVGPVPTGMCAEPRNPLPEAALPRCQKQTLDCILSCNADADGDDAAEQCRNACVAGDTTQALSGVTCQTCILAQLFACLDAEGCQSETTALACCAADCAGDDACTERECSGELQAFGLCAFYLAPQCLAFDSDFLGACFAAQ